MFRCGDHGKRRCRLHGGCPRSDPVTLATGTPGGVYHPIGNAICRMFNLEGEHQAMPCVAVSSDGSVANIRRGESGDSTFGLSRTDVAYAAFHGEGPFAAAGPDPSLRILIALYPEAFTVVARGQYQPGSCRPCPRSWPNPIRIQSPSRLTVWQPPGMSRYTWRGARVSTTTGPTRQAEAGPSWPSSRRAAAYSEYVSVPRGSRYLFRKCDRRGIGCEDVAGCGSGRDPSDRLCRPALGAPG